MEETVTLRSDTVPTGVESIHIDDINDQSPPIMTGEGFLGLISCLNELR